MRGARNFSKDDIYKVATLYYKEHMKQVEIAKLIGKTRQDVSYMLQAAEEFGIVIFTINPPDQENLAEKVSAKLKKTFPFLKEVRVVTTPLPVQNLLQAENLSDDPTRGYFDAVADLLHEIVVGRPDPALAVGTGLTVFRVLELFAARCRQAVQYPEVVPMVGLFPNEREYNAYQNTVYFHAEMKRTERQGKPMGQRTPLPPLLAPALLNSSELQSLMNDPIIRVPLDALAKVDFVFAVVEPWSSERHRRVSVVPRANAGDAVCHISGFLLKVNGTPLDEESQPLGIGLERLRAIVKQGRGRVLLAARKDTADMSTGKAVLCALRGRCGNALVLDEHAAKDILAML